MIAVDYRAFRRSFVEVYSQVGDVNQRIFVERLASRLQGPFLEVGSRNYGNTQDLRSLFGPDCEYLGVDLEGGPGVDVAIDLAEDFASIDEGLRGRRFGTIFCLSVLEHCDRPFEMADNLTRLLKPGGWLCIAAPFAWRIHDYPNDLWRFTPDGIRTLFPLIEFQPEQCLSATTRPGEFAPIDDDLGKVFFSFNRHRRNGHPMRGVSAEFLRLLSRVGLLRWLVGHRHVFTPTTILMAGQRRGLAEVDSGSEGGEAGSGRDIS